MDRLEHDTKIWVDKNTTRIETYLDKEPLYKGEDISKCDQDWESSYWWEYDIYWNQDFNSQQVQLPPGLAGNW